MEPIRSKAEAVWAAVTVDGDLRVGDHRQQAAGVRAMRQVHADLDLLGRTSWLINEYDFHWTVNHPDLLLELLESGEALGVHDHFDTHYAEGEDEIYRIAEKSKTALDGFLHTQESNLTVVIHRNGCALQSRAVYRVLKKLGYSILSDVRPGAAWSARMIPDGNAVMPWVCLTDPDQGAVQMDNLSVPLGTGPWLHDEGNWLDFRGREGPFLQVPITTMPWIEKERVNQTVQHGAPLPWIVIDTHPYDLQDPDTGEVDDARVEQYTHQLSWLRKRYQPTFLRLDQVPAVLGWE